LLAPFLPMRLTLSGFCDYAGYVCGCNNGTLFSRQPTREVETRALFGVFSRARWSSQGDAGGCGDSTGR